MESKMNPIPNLFINELFNAVHFDMFFTDDRSKPIAVLLAPKSELLYFVQLPNGSLLREMKMCRPLHETEQWEWCGIHCVPQLSENGAHAIIALLIQHKTKKYFIASFQENFSRRSMDVKDIQPLPLMTIADRKPEAYFSKNRLGHLYCVATTRNSPSARSVVDIHNNRQKDFKEDTSIQIFIIATQETLMLEHKEILNSTQKGSWMLPIVTDQSIDLLPCSTPPSDRIMSLRYGNNETSSHISPILGDDFATWPSGGIWSTPCVLGDFIIYYIFDEKTSQGAIWTLNSEMVYWTKRFVIKMHPLKDAQLVVSNVYNQFFMHGKCGEPTCKHSHIYQFSVTYETTNRKGETEKRAIFLTFSQLAFYFATTKVQIAHGDRQSGKSFLLKLKIEESKQSCTEHKPIDRYVIFTKAKSYEITTYTKTNVIKEMYSSIRDRVDLTKLNLVTDCDLFIDRKDSETLTYCEKRWLLQRPGRSFVVLNCLLESGMDQPRALRKISWHRIRKNFNAKESVASFFTLKSRSLSIKEEKTLPYSTINANKSIFINNAMEAMNEFYAGWWTTDFDKNSTVIPSCLDLEDGRYLGAPFSLSAPTKKLLTFQEALDNFVSRFQSLHIGGLLIREFSSQRNAAQKTFQILFKGWNISPFEISFIFIHPSLGLFLIDAKKTTPEKRITAHRYNQAADALLLKKQLVIRIYEMVTSEPFALPLHTILCFPCAELYVRENALVSEHLVSTNFHDTSKLRNIFLHQDRHLSLSSAENDALKMFAGTLVGYRCVEFNSGGTNALDIHKLISEQMFSVKRISSAAAKKEETPKDTDNNRVAIPMPLNPSGPYAINTIIFTAQQEAISKSDIQHIIISGPPGTGKTLIILKKAEEAARKSTTGTGNVRVITANLKLCHRFKKHFEANNLSWNRSPIVGDKFLVQPDDDVFMDELTVSNPTVQFLTKRLLASGVTVAAFTGRENPLKILDLEKKLKKSKLYTYRHFSMKTVLRSSKTIFDEWKMEFPPDYKIKIGHRIAGPAVQHIKEKNTIAVLDTLVHYIQLYIAKSRQCFVEPKHLAVLTETALNRDLIISYLASKGIRCGSVDQQVNNGQLVAVNVFTDAMSFEWPIVFVVALTSIDLYDPFFLIASSRSMVKLVVIERDYLALQREVDRLIEDDRCTFVDDVKVAEALPSLSSQYHLRKFLDTVRKARQNFSEPEDDCYNFDVNCAILRWNFCPPECRIVAPFRSCQSLMGLYETIRTNRLLCAYLLQSNEIQDSIRNLKLGEWSADGEYPRLFKNIFEERCSHLVEESRSLFLAVVKHLTNILDETNKNSDAVENLKKIFETVSPADNQVAEELHSNVGWNVIKNVFIFTCNACSFR